VKPLKHSKPKHVYIHIPFCAQKCYYCDFNVFVWQGEDWVWQYLEALEREIRITVAELPPESLQTIYVGGGTPTIFDEKQLDQFMEILNRYFPKREEDFEMTMEANPGTLTMEKLNIMASGGVNRLSIGVQSFNDQLLKQLGRNHSGKDSLQAIEMALMAGFENISIDIMFGLPNQTLDQLKDSLQMIRDFPIHHLSAYNLKVEEQTIFHKWLQEERITLPPEDLELEMYDTLIETLSQMGLLQYEISNFAKPGRESKHNLAYWYNREYYGIGAGAHGYVLGVRHVNIAPIRPYMRATMEGLPRAETYMVTEQERMEEMMFLGLRLNVGVSYERFEKEWGKPMAMVYGREIEKLVDEGLLIADEQGIRLTPRGRMLSNEVFARFMLENS
jgi:oxygen-independent coproporphyrinogen-3 oxidase